MIQSLVKRLAWLYSLVTLLAWVPSWAQSVYPVKPVRIVVPFAPSGPVDILARTLAPKFSEAMGQMFIVDNRAGSGSIIGSDMVAKSPPDGYTLLVTSSSMGINPSIYPKMPYDPVKDFTAISQIAAAICEIAVKSFTGS